MNKDYVKKCLVLFFSVAFIMQICPLISATDLTTNLMSFYDFDNNRTSGSTLIDSRNNCNGTIGAQVSNGSTGKVGQAYDFTGATSVYPINLSSCSYLDLIGDFTVNIWLYPHAWITESHASFIARGDGLTVQYFFGHESNGYLYVDYTNPSPSGWQAITDTSHIKLGNNGWAMVTYIVEISLNRIRFLINGTSISNVTMTLPMLRNYTATQIGDLYNQALDYNGLMDLMGMWNRSLTGDEIASLWNGGAGLSYNDFAGGAPSVIVNNPPDFDWTNDDTPSINFTVTDDKNNSMRCDLTFNNTLYGFNDSTLNNTATIITANASLSFFNVYNYWINCTDGTNMNKSTSRTLYLYNCAGNGGACSAGCLTFSPGCYAIAATGCDYVTT